MNSTGFFAAISSFFANFAFQFITMPMEKEIDLSKIATIRQYSAQYSNFGHDYVFSRITSSQPFPPEYIDGPMRMQGLSFILCLKGSIKIEVNVTSHIIMPCDLFAIGQNSILQIREVDWDQLDAYFLAMSPEFLRDTNFDINVLSSIKYNPTDSNVMPLKPEEVELISRYFDLIHYNTKENKDALYVRSIARCLIAALFYQTLQFVRRHHNAEEQSHPLSRRTNYVRDFMQLVHEHHRSERSVAFYASRLFISPKYLSLIIKESTGRSAAEWIDQYVIMEAKNMLRFSGKNVQQISYDLNFANQSAFGKYFKHLTGMSPTQYQRS